jgi:hypothetical protein
MKINNACRFIIDFNLDKGYASMLQESDKGKSDP